MKTPVYLIRIYTLNRYEFLKIFPGTLIDDRISDSKYTYFYFESNSVDDMHLNCQKMGIAVLESKIIS
jgi:hypothetical protein